MTAASDTTGDVGPLHHGGRARAQCSLPQAGPAYRVVPRTCDDPDALSSDAHLHPVLCLSGARPRYDARRLLIAAVTLTRERQTSGNRSNASYRLSEGVHTFSYIVRATTAGTFRTAPARAEEMYTPEVFGRTGTAVVEVKR